MNQIVLNHIFLLLFIFVYPLGKNEVEKNVAILQERREKAEATA